MCVRSLARSSKIRHAARISSEMISALSNESQKRDEPFFASVTSSRASAAGCDADRPVGASTATRAGSELRAAMVCNLSSGRQSESTHIAAYLLNLAACDILRL